MKQVVAGLLSLLSPVLIWGSAGWAQITPDNTLARPSQTRRERNITVITGGSRAGSNLFHSFREFSVPNRGAASFLNIDSDVANIFTRVTGSSVSRINGLIEALNSDGTTSSANFFLINPNGILFGRNASLNIGGSFLATTANSIRFADNLKFSAIEPRSSSLLSVSVPTGLQFNRPEVSLIRNQSRSNLVQDEFGDPIAGGLQVPTGKTLALVSGDLELIGGFLTAPGGRIELGSVKAGEVALVSLTAGWRLDYANAQQFGNLSSDFFATVNASGLRGGAIQLRAAQIDLVGSTLIFSDTFGAEPGADISIRADALNLTDFSSVSATASGDGNGGNIHVAVRQLTADAGGQLSTRTNVTGNAGNLTVTATEQITLTGRNSVLGREYSPTGLFSQTAGGSSGQGGRLTVTTPVLQLQDGASIATDTSGLGRAGTIQIQADTITLAGVLRGSNGAVVLEQNLPLPSGIFADSNATATGEGGTIQITTERLRLQDGAVVQTNAEGLGDAGDLAIRANQGIELVGNAGPNLSPTIIFAASGGLPGQDGGGTSTATGRGGNLRLVTPDLQVSDGAVIAVGSLNPNEQAEGAGSLEVQANQIILSNRGRLVAETNSGTGGNLDLRVRDSLILRNNSQISTSAGIQDRGGDGGNISIDTNFVIAPPIENSDITANAFTGNGGNVTIAAEGIIGITPRQRLTNQSDITASSEFGTPGQIIIRSPDVDPDTAAPELASAPLNDRPVQGCAATQTATTAEFFTTGRNGLPLSPSEPLSSGEVLADLRLPEAPQPGLPLVEAQGWAVDQQGAIVLVAETRPAHSCQLR